MHTITNQTIVDGRKITVVKATIKGDNTASELIKAIVFNASDFETGSTYNKIMQIEYDLNGFSAELFWKAGTDVAALSLAKDHPYHADYWDIGGLVNNGLTGRNGDILITTNGLSGTTRDGSITLYLMQRKVANLGKV